MSQKKQNTNNKEFNVPDFLNCPMILIKNSRHQEENIFLWF